VVPPASLDSSSDQTEPKREKSTLLTFLGIDWAEDHHDLHILDAEGRTLARRRVPEGLDGVTLIHQLVCDYTDDPAEVTIGIATDRGLLVGALIAPRLPGVRDQPVGSLALP
jgi:Transposase